MEGFLIISGMHGNPNQPDIMIYSDDNFYIDRKNGLKRFLIKNFPLLDWKFDDGEDSESSDYIQYVCHPEGYNSDDCILAAFTSPGAEEY